jgi:hypothetical protein
VLGSCVDGHTFESLLRHSFIISFNWKYVTDYYDNYYILYLSRTYYSSTHAVYIKFVGYSIKDPHSCHVCNCLLTVFLT